MKKIYCLLFAMLPLAAFAGEVKVTKPALTLENDTLTLWLSVDKNGKLHITKEANGSNPVRSGLTPLLGFDVWEHAYYLDYQNKRADHVNALWSIVDWDAVGKRMK